LQNTVITPPPSVDTQKNQDPQDPRIWTPFEKDIPGTQPTPKDNKQKNELIDLSNTTWVLHIALPHFVNKGALIKLTETINQKDNKDISLKITQANSSHEYKTWIQERFDEFDLRLIPSLWIESVTDNSVTLPFEQNISALFHPWVAQTMNELELKRLPFSIDPFVTVSDKEITFDQQFTRIDSEKSLLSPSDEEELLALGFGIENKDRRFLSQQWHPLPWYTDTLEIIIASSLATWGHNFLFQLFDTPLRDIVKIMDTTIALSDTMCKKNAQLCLYSNSLLHVAFTQISELQSISNTTHHVYPLPDQWSVSAQVRWFMVPSDNDNREVSLARLIWYIQEAPLADISLWDQTLSVFNTPLQSQLLEAYYKNIKKDIKQDNLHIITWTLENLKNRFENTSLPQVIQGDYSVKIFVEENQD